MTGDVAMTSRSEQAIGRDRLIRWSAAGGIVGPLLFAGLVVLGGVLDDGYSHVGQKVSELGGEGARYALLQNVNFVVLGVLVLGFAWALAQVSGAPRLGAALVGAFAVGSAVASAFLPCDTACRGEDPVALLHNVTGVVGFLAGVAGMLVLAHGWRRDPSWRSHAAFTRVAAFVAVAGLVWFVLTQALDAPTYGGVAQRSFVVVILAWVVVTAAGILRRLEGDRPGEGPARRVPSS